jgi:hypothetical protein
MSAPYDFYYIINSVSGCATGYTIFLSMQDAKKYLKKNEGGNYFQYSDIQGAWYGDEI